MRPSLLTAAFLCLAPPALFAAKATAGGALDAIDNLPRGESKRIARIEAHDGKPVPERWHIIVHDPENENGVHEYVIAGGEVVASRSISQFVESVKPQDVLSASTVKIDSTKVASLAEAYAQANNVTITSLNYILRKEGAEAAPLWNVSCLDETGKEVGRLVVSAGKGTVVSHEGFTAEPGAAAEVETQATAQVDREPRRPRKSVSSRPTTTQRAPESTPREKKGFFGRVGDFFTRKSEDSR